MSERPNKNKIEKLQRGLEKVKRAQDNQGTILNQLTTRVDIPFVWVGEGAKIVVFMYLTPLIRLLLEPWRKLKVFGRCHHRHHHSNARSGAISVSFAVPVLFKCGWRAVMLATRVRISKI